MLTSFAYIFLMGLALGYLARKMALPPLLGMLATGILLGPFALDMLSGEVLSISAQLRQIALVIILMRAGLALNLEELRRAGLPAILLCFLPALFEIGGMMLFAPWLLDISLLDAAIMGSVVAAVSPAVIVPKMLRLMEERVGTDKSIPQMIMAGASVDDIFVITIFMALLALADGGTISAVSFAQIPISIVMGVGLGALVGYLLNLYFKRFHLRDTLKLLIMVSIAFLMLQAELSLKGWLPISGLLAIMSMGIALLYFYPKFAQRVSPKYTKLWVGAEVLLFVLVGATVDINYALAAGANAVLLILLVSLVRMVGVFCCTIGSALTLRERLFCMLAYIPKATVQAAIGSIPLAMGLPCGKIVLTVAVLSIIITAPLGAMGIELSYKHLLRRE